MSRADEIRQHIRELVRFALETAPETSAIDEDATAVESWLDETEGTPPGPDTFPVRIVVDVGPVAAVPFGRLIALSLDDGTLPRMRGFEPTIVRANVYTPQPPHEVVGTVEDPS